MVSPYVKVWSKQSYEQVSCQEQTPSTSSNHLTFKVCVDLGPAAAWTKIARTHATGDRSQGVGESHGLPVKNSTLVGLASTNQSTKWAPWIFQVSWSSAVRKKSPSKLLNLQKLESRAGMVFHGPGLESPVACVAVV